MPWTVHIPKRISKHIEDLPKAALEAFFMLLHELKNQVRCRVHGLTMESYQRQSTIAT